MEKGAPVVERPSADGDRPAWVKVGIIAAVGFVIGVAWPRLLHVRLGPNAPNSSSEAAGGASAMRAPDGIASATPPPASVATKANHAAREAAASASASASPPAAAPPQINVLRGGVVSCKMDDGESKKGKECGSLPTLDAIVVPRIRKVASCSAAEGQTGKLSFLATADFASGRFNWDVGKSSTVGNLDGIGSCLKTHFQGVVVSGIAHEHPRYTVAYTAVFTAAEPSHAASPAADKPEATTPTPSRAEPKESASGAGADDSPTPAAPAGGEATVAWEVALVRDVPKTGQVVARLPRGSKVKVGSVKDGFYSIKYGDGFGSEGWVYRGAIGR